MCRRLLHPRARQCSECAVVGTNFGTKFCPAAPDTLYERAHTGVWHSTWLDGRLFVAPQLNPVGPLALERAWRLGLAAVGGR